MPEETECVSAHVIIVMCVDRERRYAEEECDGVCGERGERRG